MAFGRRKFLIGLGGAVVGLPFFEGLAPKMAKADAPAVPPYALFYRRGNGVQQAIYTRNTYPSVGFWTRQDTPETERWWPTDATGTEYPFGPLATFGPTSALNELEAYVSKATIIKGLRHPYGTENGHPEGAVQGLTGAGVAYRNSTPDIAIENLRPMGESLDNRIARELSGGAQVNSLYMGFANDSDATISWKRTGTTLTGLTAINDLNSIYNTLFSKYNVPPDQLALLNTQRKSVNDLVRDDLKTLQADPRMSKSDLDRLQAHLDVIRDTEVALAACTLGDITSQLAAMDSSSITSVVNVMGRLAALAVSCGVSQSVVMNIGIPQDVILYKEVSAAVGQYVFHAISHRQATDTSGGSPLATAQLYHHQIDRYHLQRFKSVLDVLSTYSFADGTTLVDHGANVHYSDLGAGQHTCSLLPYFYVGSAGGKLVTGQYMNANATPGVQQEYLVKFLNTIGAAVGCKSADGQPLHDFNSGDGLLYDFVNQSYSSVATNNNYKPETYTYTVYWQKPAGGLLYPQYASGSSAPAITGRLDQLML